MQRIDDYSNSDAERKYSVGYGLVQNILKTIDKNECDAAMDAIAKACKEDFVARRLLAPGKTDYDGFTDKYTHEGYFTKYCDDALKDCERYLDNLVRVEKRSDVGRILGNLVSGKISVSELKSEYSTSAGRTADNSK